MLLACFLGACTSLRHSPDAIDLQALWPADAILLGEQHDAAAHQAVQADVVRRLASQGRLAALALEMADEGSSTQGLDAQASEANVRSVLQWNDAAWPWSAYGPAVMAAVRAGVPVLGANLPRAGMRAAMQDAALDGRLLPDALQAQQDAIRTGHCGLLPPAQIGPMARIQIARDMAMARTVQQAARPRQAVVLLAGSGHVDRTLGAPLHLAPGFRAKAVRLLAGGTAGPASEPGFDVIWPTPAVEAKDHCADLRRQMGR